MALVDRQSYFMSVYTEMGDRVVLVCNQTLGASSLPTLCWLLDDK